MFPGFTSHDALTVDQVRIAMLAHGGSIVEIERVADTGQWRRSCRGRRPYNRRITAMTPMRFTGGAAGSALLRTNADPTGRRVLGMLNNCAGGVTPWGTILTGEENFNQYFVGGDAVAGRGQAGAGPLRHHHHRPLPERLPEVGAGRPALRPRGRAERGQPVRLHRRDRPVRPGLDPAQAHRARPLQARGRRTSRSAKDGRVAAYMGDDERFDYIYKFVSSRKMRRGDSRADRERNLRLLEDGTLLRREVHRRLARRRDRRQRHAAVRRRVRRVRAVDPAHRRQDAASCPASPSSEVPGAHPAGRGHGRRRPRWTGPRTSSPTR